MSDRVLSHVRRSRDECPCHPSVPVVMHDDEPTPHRVDGAVGQCSATKFGGVPCAWDRDEPPEITAARASLPEHRPTDRDWFAHYRDRA